MTWRGSRLFAACLILSYHQVRRAAEEVVRVLVPVLRSHSMLSATPWAEAILAGSQTSLYPSLICVLVVAAAWQSPPMSLGAVVLLPLVLLLLPMMAAAAPVSASSRRSVEMLMTVSSCLCSLGCCRSSVTA